MSKKISFTLPFGDTEIDVSGWWTPAQKGVYFGEPEDCCPEYDAEFEWEQVMIDGKDVTEMFMSMYANDNKGKPVDWLNNYIDEHWECLDAAV